MQDTANIFCPYCGEINEIFLDFSGGLSQQYREECQVCCRSWEVHIDIKAGKPEIKIVPDTE